MSTESSTPNSYTCGTCGKVHPFPAYVYANWNYTVTHHCDCGAAHKVRKGKAKQAKAGNFKVPA